MCNVYRLRVARNELPLPPPIDRAWLRVRKIIDVLLEKPFKSAVPHTVLTTTNEAGKPGV